jgi:hypothetical protein
MTNEPTKHRAPRAARDLVRREFEALAGARALLRAFERTVEDEAREQSLDELRRELVDRLREVLLVGPAEGSGGQELQQGTREGQRGEGYDPGSGR